MLLLVLLVVKVELRAQNESEIKGIVVTEINEPLAGATIQIQGKAGSAISDSLGKFVIKAIYNGKVVLVVKYIGYNNYVKSIVVNDAKPTFVKVNMSFADEALQAVEVIGRKEKGYKNSQSFVASKTASLLKDIPQSVSYVTKELMADQQAIRLGDIIKNFSGVNQFSFYDDVTIRGFRVSGGEGGVQLMNGLRTTTGFWKQSLTNYLEKVEVIKGPASALFGNTSPGGTINRVTKKPLFDNKKSISLTTGSFNTIRALADFTGPMNKEKTILYRLNLGYENAQTFRDLQFDKNLIIAPSFSFIPTEKTRLNFDLVYNKSNSRLDRGQPVFGNNDIYSVPISRSLSQVNDYLYEDNIFITTSLNHKFSQKLQLNISYIKTAWEEDLLEHRTSNAYAKDSANKDIPTLVGMQVFIRKRKRFVDNLSAYLTWNFNIKAVEHKLLVGIDYGQEKQPFGGSQLVASGYRNNTNTGATSYNAAQPTRFLYETVNGVKRPVANVAHFDLTAASPYALQDMSKYFYARTQFDPTQNALNGAYLQNQLKYKNWQLLVGLRLERFNDKVNFLKPTESSVAQSALIPRVGLVYSVNKTANLYATYTKGYNPQTASTIANPNAGGPFDPLYSSLIEAGAKAEWFSNKLVTTASVYQIKLQNVLYNAGVAGQPDLLTQVGEEVAKGFEFETTGQITNQWNLVLAYAFNETAITKSKNVNEIGRQKPNAPKHQGSIWTKYIIAKGALKGLGLAVGSNFVTERNVSLNAIQTLPAYMVAKAALYYKVDKFQVQVNVNNVFNKVHWVGGYDYLRLFPGATRNALTTISYNF